MQTQMKRRKLPRGLHRDSRSPCLFFKWRDAMGKQRRHSTQTDGPEEALLVKLQFLKEQRQKPQEIEAHTEDLGKLPLNKAAELYFGWKSAKNSDTTIEREKRIFNAAFGSGRAVRSIKLFRFRQYQQQRRHHVILTTQALAANLQSQAFLQRMLAAQLRQEAAKLAHTNMLIKESSAGCWDVPALKQPGGMIIG